MATKRRPLQNSLWSNVLRIHILLLACLCGYGVDWDITTAYLHPQIGAMGGAGIAWSDATAASYLNPGLLGRTSKWGVSFYQASLEQSIVNQHFQWTLPIGSITHQLSYYRQSLMDIPITQLIDERIRQNGSFGASISQWRWSAGTTWEDILWSRRVGLGTSVGYQQYDFSAGSSLFYQLGLHVQPSAWDSLGFGLVMDSTEGQYTWRGGISSHSNPLDILVDWDGKSIRGGIQYAMNEMWSFRGGLESRFLTFGSGLNYDQLVGILPQNIAFSIDLATQIPLDPAYAVCAYAGITIREQDHLRIPMIEDYPRATNKKTVTLQGWAEPKNTVWLQVNEQDRIRTQSNENGQWSTNIPLIPGNNKITAWASDIRRERPSIAGSPVYIYQDDSLPEITLKAWIVSDNIRYTLSFSKILADDPQIRTDKMSSQTIPRLEGKYHGSLNRNDVDHEWTITARDLVNNASELVINDPIVRLESPKSNISSTQEDKFLFSGNANRYSELALFSDTAQDQQPVKLQKNGKFMIYGTLIVGKNHFRLVDKRKNAEMTYPLTIIRIHLYRDTNNDDIDQLATLGILDSTPYFKPTSPLTQAAALLWLARLKEIKIPNIDSDSPAWWKAIAQKALKEHWIETHNDNKVLTRKDAMLLMTKVLGLNVFETLTDSTHVRNISSQNPDAKLVTWFAEHGMISGDSINLYEPLQRGEFATWLRNSNAGDYRITKFFGTN